MLYWEEMKESNSPPSYTEAISLPAPFRPPTPIQERGEKLKFKLCRMEKTSAGYGFHLNGIQGSFGQHIKEVGLNKKVTYLIIAISNKRGKTRFVSGGERWGG